MMKRLLERFFTVLGGISGDAEGTHACKVLGSLCDGICTITASAIEQAFFFISALLLMYIASIEYW